MLLNGKAVFQRLVLDQGYYPDGIMTAPSDEALERDIIISKAAGFNGARLHQKVFEERFLYHADRLGYLVWGEYGDWGMQFAPMTVPNPEFNQPFAAMFAQWSEALARGLQPPVDHRLVPAERDQPPERRQLSGACGRHRRLIQFHQARRPHPPGDRRIRLLPLRSITPISATATTTRRMSESSKPSLRTSS